MSVTGKWTAGLLALGLLGACEETSSTGARTLSVGEQISVQTLLAENPGKLACTEYRAASNSCASLITSKVSGSTLLAREVAMVPGLSGKPERIEVITRSRIKGLKVCAGAKDISLGKSDLSKEAADFVLKFTRDLVADRGGVCGTYFRAGDGYIVRSVGGDGTPFPPGDTKVTYVDKGASLRVQNGG